MREVAHRVDPSLAIRRARVVGSRIARHRRARATLGTLPGIAVQEVRDRSRAPSASIAPADGFVPAIDAMRDTAGSTSFISPAAASAATTRLTTPSPTWPSTRGPSPGAPPSAPSSPAWRPSSSRRVSSRTSCTCTSWVRTRRERPRRPTLAPGSSSCSSSPPSSGGIVARRVGRLANVDVLHGTREPAHREQLSLRLWVRDGPRGFTRRRDRSSEASSEASSGRYFADEADVGALPSRAPRFNCFCRVVRVGARRAYRRARARASRAVERVVGAHVGGARVVRDGVGRRDAIRPRRRTPSLGNKGGENVVARDAAAAPGCARAFHLFYNSPSVSALVPLQALLTLLGNCACGVAAWSVVKRRRAAVPPIEGGRDDEG